MVAHRPTAKCSPSSIYNIYDEASPSQKELLRASVFGGIFQIPKGVGFLGDVVDAMLNCWVDKNHFRIKKTSVYLRKLDIALILGLAVVEPPQYSPPVKPPKEQTIRHKYFRGMPNGKILRSHIDSAIRRAESDEDFVKLSLLFVLCVFLFPESHHQLAEKYVELIDDIENFNITPWGLLVYRDLLEYISKGAANRKVADLDKTFKTYNTYGCICVLQWWAYEMMPEFAPPRTQHKNPFPRLLKWSEKAQSRIQGSTLRKLLSCKIIGPIEPMSSELDIPVLREYLRGRNVVPAKRKEVEKPVKKAVEVGQPKKKSKITDDELEYEDTGSSSNSLEEAPAHEDRPRTRGATMEGKGAAATTSSNDSLMRRIDGLELENLKLTQRVSHLEQENEVLVTRCSSIETICSSLETLCNNLNERLSSRDVELQKIAHINTLVRKDQGILKNLLQNVLEATNKVQDAALLELISKVSESAFEIPISNQEVATAGAEQPESQADDSQVEQGPVAEEQPSSQVDTAPVADEQTSSQFDTAPAGAPQQMETRLRTRQLSKPTAPTAVKQIRTTNRKGAPTTKKSATEQTKANTEPPKASTEPPQSEPSEEEKFMIDLWKKPESEDNTLVSKVGNLTLRVQSFRCLEGEGYLDNIILGGYLRLLEVRDDFKHPEVKDRSYIMHPAALSYMFYDLKDFDKFIISEKLYVEPFQIQVQRWAEHKQSENQGKGLFETFFFNKFRNLWAHDCSTIYFPIHSTEPLHWALAIAKVKERAIMIVDPIFNRTSKERYPDQLRTLAHYLPGILYSYGDSTALSSNIYPWSSNDCRIKALPRQTNSSDCGVFVLKYVEYFMSEKKFDFGQEDMKRFRGEIGHSLATYKGDENEVKNQELDDVLNM